MKNRQEVFVPESDIAHQHTFMEQVRRINEESNINIAKQKTFFTRTFGCQMNENDSERLAGMLALMGYEPADKEKEADLVIYNTCCVRENAELKVYGHLGGLKVLKKNRSDMIIAVCGCMMQQEEVVNHIKTKYRHVDLIFGTHNLFKFPELLFNALNNNTNIIDVWESAGSIAEGMPILRKEGIKAWVTVMYGCNNFCSYCIVPYVRGRERSRNADDIIKEIDELVSQGFKEITLLGQNVNSYGKDLSDGSTFASLLKMIDEIEGIYRIRFMTSHPKDLTDELIEAIRDCRKVCQHLHLPVQSGSSRILHEMNRKYDKEQYLELVKKIRVNIPDIVLSTDIIVGFPGETEGDFEDTLDVITKARFDSAYTFLYSKRTGTPAAKIEEQISEDVKKARFDRLVDVQNMISKELNNKLEGQIVEVLVEGLSKTSTDTYTGRTCTNKIVNFIGNTDLIGTLVNVEIYKALTWSLEGRIVE